MSVFENHFLIKGMDHKRALFEKILPFYTELLKLETQPSLIPIYTKGWTSALMTKKQKETLLQMGWEIEKGAFLNEGL